MPYYWLRLVKLGLIAVIMSVQWKVTIMPKRYCMWQVLRLGQLGLVFDYNKAMFFWSGKCLSRHNKSATGGINDHLKECFGSKA